jgi:tripartite ATP-independent transporter DctM subunit
MLWLIIYSKINPNKVPPANFSKNYDLRSILMSLIPPLLLIAIVLGSILTGIATPTESAAIGAVGSIFLAILHKKFNLKNMQDVIRSTTCVSAMVFTILIGATIFSLVFRGYGGDEIIHNSLADLPGGIFTAMLLTMVVIFLLGFILDFIEIIFVVVPIVTPILLHMGADPVWLAIMIAVNLQTSFLTPPFGFALFYLRGVAPKSVLSIDIYKGIIPFVIMQILVMCLLALLPSLATKLPDAVYGKLESNNVIQPYHYGDPVDF